MGFPGSSRFPAEQKGQGGPPETKPPESLADRSGVIRMLGFVRFRYQGIGAVYAVPLGVLLALR